MEQEEEGESWSRARTVTIMESKSIMDLEEKNNEQ